MFRRRGVNACQTAPRTARDVEAIDAVVGAAEKRLADEEAVEIALGKLSPEERKLVEAQRRQLTEMGVTREPLRTEMACMFAEVLLDLRRPA